MTSKQKEKKSNKKAEKDERYRLTAKACFAIAISDTRISPTNVLFEDINNQTFESAYIILERRMNDAGYITDKDGKTKDNKDSDAPEAIFSRTIKGFYPNASNEQIDAAWEKQRHPALLRWFSYWMGINTVMVWMSVERLYMANGFIGKPAAREPKRLNCFIVREKT